MLEHDDGRKELISEFGRGDTIGVVEFATGMHFKILPRLYFSLACFDKITNFILCFVVFDLFWKILPMIRVLFRVRICLRAGASLLGFHVD